MDNNPVIHAMIAVFLALGEAVGEHTLQRAGNLIRDLLSNVLETVLVGIDYDPTEPDPDQMPSPETATLFDRLATVH
jgi:hypothetical protein